MRRVFVHAKAPLDKEQLRTFARSEEGLAGAARLRGDAAGAELHADIADMAGAELESRERFSRRVDAAHIERAPWIQNVLDGPRGTSVLDK